nr:organic cation/carnitine transporter 7-like [Ipomoea batatas]
MPPPLHLPSSMEEMLLAFIGPSVKALWRLSAVDEGLITTVVFAGMLIISPIISEEARNKLSKDPLSICSSIAAIAAMNKLGMQSKCMETIIRLVPERSHILKTWPRKTGSPLPPELRPKILTGPGNLESDLEDMTLIADDEVGHEELESADLKGEECNNGCGCGVNSKKRIGVPGRGDEKDDGILALMRGCRFEG